MKKKPWGISISVDIYGCDKNKIRDKESIRAFVAQLCSLIKVKPFGPCTVVYFGEKEKIAGYSMTQLIETSLISAHFANATNTVYLDVFSCKAFDPVIVTAFAKTWFKGTKIKTPTKERV